MLKKSDRSVKNRGRKALLGVLAVAAMLSGVAVTPAFADRWDRHHYRHERWEHRHYHRPHVYYAPGYYGPPPVVYEAPPPVYYAPPPPPPPPVYYGPPSLNVVIPIR